MAFHLKVLSIAQQQPSMLVLLLLITNIHTINQTCNTSSLPQQQLPISVQNDFCPVRSHCMSNYYCACDAGFVGDCSQSAFEMRDGTKVQTVANNVNYTFFSITQEVDSYVILIFEICHPAASSNLQTIDVWQDKGDIGILDRSNAIPGGKNWEIKQGCLKLTTPLLLFERQANGLAESFIIGIKLTQEGEVAFTLQLQIDTIDFWALFMKFLFIIGGIFLVIFIIAIAIFIIKWRRRGLGRPRASSQNDISHFGNFMPRYKLSDSSRYRVHDESCAVCLLEMGEDEWLRKTVCNHIFHQECLDQWCRTNLNCPICRRSFQLKNVADSTVESMGDQGSGLRNPLIEER